MIKRSITGIGKALQSLFNYIKNFIVTVIKGILQFARDVVNYFKTLSLDRNRDTPFIVEGQKLKEMIDNAPVVDVGIFEGVFNEETNTIEHYREISADSLDKTTKNILAQASSDNPIVVLN